MTDAKRTDWRPMRAFPGMQERDFPKHPGYWAEVMQANPRTGEPTEAWTWVILTIENARITVVHEEAAANEELAKAAAEAYRPPLTPVQQDARRARRGVGGGIVVAALTALYLLTHNPVVNVLQIASVVVSLSYSARTWWLMRKHRIESLARAQAAYEEAWRTRRQD